MIICVGEIVWDIFDTKEVLGGAPLNAAFHLNAVGQDVQLISRVGEDELGIRALEEIKHLGLLLDTIQKDSKYPTGRVLVHLNENNEPSFEILSPAAWDFISLQQVAPQTKPFHLVFGTLAQRSSMSRATIQSLIKSADKIFYDVNLRPPHTAKDCVLESLRHATVGKMNEEELAIINSWSSLPTQSLEKMAQAVLLKFSLDVLAVTLGKAGSLLICREGIFKHAGFSVQVVDTVGAGDAFFAALIDGILKKDDWQNCLANANKRGAYVASRTGATPDMHAFQKE